MAAPARRRPPAGWSRSTAWSTRSPTQLGLDGHPAIGWENQVPTGLEIDADPEQLFRVLVNLGRNAVQALEGDPEPSLVRRLIVIGRREGRLVTIRVDDTGPGVPERARAHLFQAFQGGARPGGTGLGLAIAAELVRAHGGTDHASRQGGPGRDLRDRHPRPPRTEWP